MADQESSTIEVRKPIKVLHFSDGVIEVFEDDEKKPEEPKKEEINEVSRNKQRIRIRNSILL